MTQQIKYTCDMCRKPVEETPSGKTWPAITASFSSGNYSACGDFCSIDCLEKWVRTHLPMKIG